MSRLRWPDSTNSVSEKPGTIQTDVGHEQDVRRGEATGGVVVDLEVSKPQAEVGTGAGRMTGPVGRVRRAHGSPECCGWSSRSPGR